MDNDNNLEFSLVIQQLGIVPAALLTDVFDIASPEAKIANAPWSLVCLTGVAGNDFPRFFQTSVREVVNCRFSGVGDIDQKIIPAKKCLPILYLAKSGFDQTLPSGRIQNCIREILKASVGQILSANGIVFVKNIPNDFYALLDSVLTAYPRKGSVFLLSDPKNEYAKYWITKGIASICPSMDSELWQDFPSDFKIDEDNSVEHLYINQRLQKIPKSDIYKISQFGQLLTQETIGDIPMVSEGDMASFFKYFLERSVGSFPDWYCYDTAVGFHLARTIESEILKIVNKALVSADKNDRGENPVLLRGQSFAGKTNTLCAIAYHIYKEKRYPVIYMPSTIIPTNVRDFSESLSYLINTIEHISEPPRPTLIVWDSACRQASELNFALRLLEKLRSEGRQLQLVCTAYNYESEDSKAYLGRFTSREIQARLDETEQQSLFKMLKDKGGFSDQEIRNCVSRCVNNPHFIASLYQLSEIRTELQAHIIKESDSINIDLDKILNEIIAKEIKQNIENSWSTMFEDQFKQLEVQMGSEKGTETSEEVVKGEGDFRERLHHAMACIALCTYYGSSVPIELVLRLLKSDFSSSYWKIYNAFSNNTMLRELPGDPGPLQIRSELEAGILLDSEDKEGKGSCRLGLLMDILDAVNFANDQEVELVRKLIQAVGPNCKFMDRDKYSLWKIYRGKFPSLWGKLKELRRESKDAEKLFPQELSLIRECYKDKLQDEEACRILNEAQKEARDALYKLREKGTTLEANLSVEYCNISILLIGKLCSTNRMKFGTLFTENRYRLLSLSCTLDNSYIKVTLLKLGRYYFQCLDNKEEQLPLLHELAHYCNLFNASNDYELSKEIAAIYECIDNFNMDDELFKKTIAEGKPYGIYIKASNAWRNLENRSYEQEHASYILMTYLEKREYWDIIRVDPCCISLLVELKWLSFTGCKIIPSQEKTRIALLPEKWERIYDLCKIYFQCDSHVDNPQLKYLFALAAVHSQNHAAECPEILRNLYQKVFIRGNWYLICDENGSPIVCSGEIKKFDEEIRHGSLIIQTVKNGHIPHFDDIYFRPEALGKTPRQCIPNMVTGDFWISISFSGLQAVRPEAK